jgi:hypothetical protein
MPIILNNNISKIYLGNILIYDQSIFPSGFTPEYYSSDILDVYVGSINYEQFISYEATIN